MDRPPLVATGHERVVVDDEHAIEVAVRVRTGLGQHEVDSTSLISSDDW
jgi:hypothetical protein